MKSREWDSNTFFIIVSPTEKYNWITLVQRAGLNPGKLVKSHSRRLKELVSSTLTGEDNDVSKKKEHQAIVYT
jgi:hypothetical protein